MPIRASCDLGRTPPFGSVASMTHPIVETVARAIKEDDPIFFAMLTKDELEHTAQAAIIALFDAIGEPTRAMWAAGGDAVVGKTSVHHDVVTEAVWTAMLTRCRADILGEPTI